MFKRIKKNHFFYTKNFLFLFKLFFFLNRLIKPVILFHVFLFFYYYLFIFFSLLSVLCKIFSRLLVFFLSSWLYFSWFSFWSVCLNVFFFQFLLQCCFPRVFAVNLVNMNNPNAGDCCCIFFSILKLSILILLQTFAEKYLRQKTDSHYELGWKNDNII